MSGIAGQEGDRHFMTRLLAIFPAAGKGLRMGILSRPKVLLPVAGVPMILRTLTAFSDAAAITEAVIASPAETIDEINKVINSFNSFPVRFVTGADERWQSVRNAFETLDASPEDLVLIHDADRPLVGADIIRRVCEKAANSGAAICAVLVTDTLKEATNDRRIIQTHQRERFFLAQTPQVFRYDMLKKAYSATGTEAASDEASIVERAGFAVHIVDGSSRNIKVTYQDDLILAERLIAESR